MSKNKILLIYVIFTALILYLAEFLIHTYEVNTFLFMLISKFVGFILIFFTGMSLYFYLSKQEKYNELQKEEQFLQTLINSMVDYVNFKDGEGKWIKTNDFGLKLFQIENVDYKGKTDRELPHFSDFYQDSLVYCEKSDEEAWIKHSIQRFEETISLRNGDEKYFDTIKVPLFEEDGSRKALVVIGRDITERVQAEKQLLYSQQQYKSLFDFNPDPMLVIDLTGKISKVNPRFELVTGMFQNELIGISLMDLIGNADDKKNFHEAFFQVISNKRENNSGDIQFIKKNGDILLLSCTLVPMLIEEEIVAIISYAKDVTLIRETEEALRKTDKLSIVGELAASVAHEIRNPLTSLKGFLQLLNDEEENKNQAYYTIMLNELDRINLIVSELLVLAKPQELLFKKHNLMSLMEDVTTLLSPEAGSYGTLITLPSVKVPSVLCEANQIKQVLINIIKNSLEAYAKDIYIDFTEHENWIMITVRDDGCGMEKNRIKHLGEPFYSSKEKGTGLGLTVSYKIIEAHGGKLTFNSEMGQGTVVVISLPKRLA